MADLFPNKLHSPLSFNSPFSSSSSSSPLTRSPLLNFSTIRFRRTRLSHSSSSSVLATLSLDPTRLTIVSTSEQSDGSVVFKFGDASDNSQSIKNVYASDAELEVIGGLDDEEDINCTSSELVGTSDDELEAASDDIDSNEDECSNTVSDEDEKGNIEVEGSKESKAEEKSELEPEKTNVDCVEDEQINYGLISTFEIENSNDSERVNNDIDKIDSLVTTLDCNADLIVEKFEGTLDGELVAAVSTFQLDLDGNDLEKVSEKSSCVEDSERAVTLDYSELESNGKQLGNEGDDDTVTVEIAETSSVIEASEVRVCLKDDDELDSNLKQVENEENVDDKSREIVDMNSLVEASDGSVKQVENEENAGDKSREIVDMNSPVEASDSSVKQVENEENFDDKSQDIMDMNSLIEASHSNAKQVANEENVDDKSQEIVDMNSLIEASDRSVKQVVNEEDDDNDKLGIAPIVASDTDVSLEDDELDSNVKQVENQEDNGNDTLEIAEINSPTEVLEMAVSLEDDKLESFVKEVAENEEVDSNKLTENAGLNLLVEASDMEVSLEDSELDSNVKHVGNDEDVGNDMVELSERNSPIGDSEMAVSFEDVQLDRNVKQVLANMEEGDSKLQEITDMNLLVEVPDMAASLEVSELDSNETHMVNEDDDWVELIEKPAQLEAEPILDEEASFNSEDDVITLESTSAPEMVDDAAPSVILLSDDALFGDDFPEAASLYASNISVEEANVDSVSSVEISTPTLFLSSAAASLPHSSEALTGGADAYFVCENWFGVADGVGQWSFGGTERGRYAHELMQNCEKVALNSWSAGLADVKDALQQIAAMTESTGAARVLIAHFANQALHVANIGDTGFVIVRNGKIFKKSTPMVHEFNFPYAIGSGVDPLEAVEEYHVDLEDGDVIVAATDGLFDNLYEPEIASMLAKSLGAGMEPKDLAELLVTKAQEMGSSAHGRSPFADAAQAAGHTGVVGGKLDHVTVIVSLVQTSK